MPMGDPPTGSLRVFDGSTHVFTGERWVELPRYSMDFTNWREIYYGPSSSEPTYDTRAQSTDASGGRRWWDITRTLPREHTIIRGERVDFVWVDDEENPYLRRPSLAPIMDIEPEDL